ncbi:MAG: hypothetical protein WC479_00150 [Candidatus Izemoplasmatales bacterium]|jgi:hypothetical protein|nr:hypothetical protein [Candidatus Izemoplasmatales bacterium]MDD3865040.1 hypothetical protein [Candidatus Izemoplasmatales bacterium]
MKEIQEKIQKILETPNEINGEKGYSTDWEPSENDDDFGELYTDLYVLIRNIDDFFTEDGNPKALDLVDSFLIESLITLKKNHDIIRVESGDDYVKATAFTPDGETAGYLFDSAVQINTMMEIYNKTLAENNMPRIDAGIGMATFPGNADEEEETCHCHEEGHQCESDDEECQCHGHGIESLEFGYATDLDNTALHMATIANSDELDPIVINEPTYSLMSDSEALKEFLDHNLEKVIFEGEDFSVFHGNIVSEEE